MIFTRSVLFGSTVNTDGAPSPSEESYWIDDRAEVVITDGGQLTIIDSIISYWCDDRGMTLIDDRGEEVALLYYKE